MQAGYSPSDSEQLDLWEADVRAMPWRGRSPRALTRGNKALFLSREAQKHERFFVDPAQSDMFLAAKREPPRYEGAPSLLPLPQEI